MSNDTIIKTGNAKVAINLLKLLNESVEPDTLAKTVVNTAITIVTELEIVEQFAGLDMTINPKSDYYVSRGTVFQLGIKSKRSSGDEIEIYSIDLPEGNGIYPNMMEFDFTPVESLNPDSDVKTSKGRFDIKSVPCPEIRDVNHNKDFEGDVLVCVEAAVNGGTPEQPPELSTYLGNTEKTTCIQLGSNIFHTVHVAVQLGVKDSIAIQSDGKVVVADVILETTDIQAIQHSVVWANSLFNGSTLLNLDTDFTERLNHAMDIIRRERIQQSVIMITLTQRTFKEFAWTHGARNSDVLPQFTHSDVATIRNSPLGVTFSSAMDVFKRFGNRAGNSIVQIDEVNVDVTLVIGSVDRINLYTDDEPWMDIRSLHGAAVGTETAIINVEIEGLSKTGIQLNEVFTDRFVSACEIIRNNPDKKFSIGIELTDRTYRECRVPNSFVMNSSPDESRLKKN